MFLEAAQCSISNFMMQTCPSLEVMLHLHSFQFIFDLLLRSLRFLCNFTRLKKKPLGPKSIIL